MEYAMKVTGRVEKTIARDRALEMNKTMITEVWHRHWDRD